MSSENVAVVRSVYDAFAAGDVGGVLGRMSPSIEWNEAENFPYCDGNPYRGPEAIANGVFARLATEWVGFAAVIDEILDAGNTVVALGRYQGTCRATGKSIDAQLAHVWRLAEGKVVGFQQYTDTHQATQTMSQDD